MQPWIGKQDSVWKLNQYSEGVFAYKLLTLTVMSKPVALARLFVVECTCRMTVSPGRILGGRPKNGEKITVIDHILIFGVRIDAVTMAQATALAEEFIASRRPHLIVTANTEMIMLARHDETLRHIVNEAALVVPDGAGIIWAAKRLGHPLPERVAGFDLVMQLLAIAPAKGYKLFFLGGAPGVAEAAAAAAGKTYPGLNIVGTHHGYFSAAAEAQVVEMIIKQKPDILLAALGVPKQEKWLYEKKDQLAVPLLIGVGGTFDVLAGRAERAPLWMQQAGLEWLFRLIKEPWRAKRMLALPRFALKVLTVKKH